MVSNTNRAGKQIEKSISSFIQRNKIRAGVTPKLIASAKLSNSAPNRLDALSILAVKPSIRSKNAATKYKLLQASIRILKHT